MARLLADPVEKCREEALNFFALAAQQLPEPAFMLSCLMPAMTGRMGDMPVVEPSEEQRLAITKLVAGPLILRTGSGLLPYLTLVVKVVCRALEDPFHDIKKVTHLDAKLHVLAAYAGMVWHACLNTSPSNLVAWW